MKFKRVTLFAGHYGSGKTNIAVNYAKKIKESGIDTVIADLDIVNPYFRTKDSEQELNELGIELVCSDMANTNLDTPALPKDIYRILADKSKYVVMDIGGDERGALALGRYSEDILTEDNYEMIYVVNPYSPLTSTPEEAVEVMREIEYVSKIKFTAIANNANVGNDTKAEDVISCDGYINKLKEITGLDVIFTSAVKAVTEKLQKHYDNVFELTLQKKYFDIRKED